MKLVNAILRFKYFLFLLILLFYSINPKIYPQSPAEIVAKAGDISITKDEYKMRFELSPHPRMDKNFDSTIIKHDFLKTLVAEKLLVQAAIQEGLDKSSEYIRNMNYMRNYYLRDALYKIEVKAKMIIPDSEYVKGKKKIGKTIQTKFIFSQDENEIVKIYESLNNGASFDSILSLRSENSEQESPAEITFGKMNEKIEDRLFVLKTGEFTPPIELEEGWYICKVYSITKKSFLEEADLRKTEMVVADRIENKTYEAFYKKLFKGIVINVDRDIFTSLYKLMQQFINDNEKGLNQKTGKYYLYENEVNNIRKLLSEEILNSVFVKFPQDPVLLNGFLDFMSMEGIDFVSADTSHFKSRLNAYISTFIQNETLAREALIRGYDKLPDVDANINIWKDSYLSKLMMKKIYKEENVTDDEAYEFYSKNNQVIQQSDEVKIAEILTDNLDIVKEIFDELNKGRDFVELANQFTLRDSLKSSSGVYDYQPVNKEGEIWKTASNMKIGEIFGPINLQEGFSIIKLLDKRKGKREQFTSFEEAKDDIKNILRTGKMFDKLDNLTAKLAFEKNIEINEKVLNTIKVNYTNMIVYKRFGFGGQQIAVPYTPNFTSWFLKYEDLKKSITY